MMLDFRVIRNGRVIHEDTALNEATIRTSAVGKEIHFVIYADGVELIRVQRRWGHHRHPHRFHCLQRLLPAGPLWNRPAENILVTPICAHDLRVRPCVLSKDRVVTVELGHIGKKGVFLSPDGGSFRLSDHDKIELRSSKSRINLVRVTNRSFYEILHQKLGT